MPFSGDNAYADFPPFDTARAYQQVWEDEAGLRALGGGVPVFMMYDDHEIKNDWR